MSIETYRLMHSIYHLFIGQGQDQQTRQVRLTLMLSLDRNSCLQKALPRGHSMTQVGHGISGMKQLITNCPALGTRPEFRGIMNLKGLDVIATRLWLDQRLPTRFPANVLAGFESDVGGTFFNLTELQVSLALPALISLHTSLCFGCSFHIQICIALCAKNAQPVSAEY